MSEKIQKMEVGRETSASGNECGSVDKGIFQIVSEMVGLVLDERVREKENLAKLERMKTRLVDFISCAIEHFKKSDLTFDPDTVGKLEKVLQFFREYFCDIDLHKIFIGQPGGGRIAAYYYASRTVKLRENFNCEKVLDLSILLHEVVHAWQRHKDIQRYGSELAASSDEWLHDWRAALLKDELEAYQLQLDVINLYSGGLLERDVSTEYLALELLSEPDVAMELAERVAELAQSYYVSDDPLERKESLRRALYHSIGGDAICEEIDGKKVLTSFKFDEDRLMGY